MSDTLTDYERQWLEGVATEQDWQDGGFKEGGALIDGDGFMLHECGHELVVAEMRLYRQAKSAQCLIVCFRCSRYWRTGVKAFANGGNESTSRNASGAKNTGEKALVRVVQARYNRV